MKRTSWIYFAFVFTLGITIGTFIPKTTEQHNSSFDFIKEIVENNYVDNVSTDTLEIEGIEAMLKYLDPHSIFLPPVQNQLAQEDMQGNFDGIGVQFRMMKDSVTVIIPIAGGPSAKVGIKAGDRIVKADSITISGVNMNSDNIVKILKGKRGSSVKLTVVRPGLARPLVFDVKRNIIKTYSVDADFMVDKNTGSIKISKFSATTSEEFDNALNNLENQRMKNLIIDLRGNGGGYMVAAIEIVEHFLEKGDLILYTEGSHRSKEEYKVSENGDAVKYPLVIMIDEMSASASEIVAGAIQDNDRGIIIGRRSFGKGLVQEQMQFKNNSSLLLTVARYYTPSGRCIQKPYKRGMLDYEEEMLLRYTSGELMSFDSVHLDSTQRYTTKKGRTVYGGGGIMPYIYSPYLTDSLATYYNLLNNKGIILQYAFDYIDKNRNSLEKYKSFEQFNKNFIVSDYMLLEIVNAGIKAGISNNSNSMIKYKQKIATVLKASIANDLFDNKGFYPIYLQIDSDFQLALENLSAINK